MLAMCLVKETGRCGFHRECEIAGKISDACSRRSTVT